MMEARKWIFRVVSSRLWARSDAKVGRLLRLVSLLFAVVYQRL